MNNLGEDIFRNKIEFNELKERYERCVNENIVLIPGNKPFSLTFDDSVFVDLQNNEILNDLYSLNIKVKRYNKDVENINGSFEPFKLGLINKTVSPESFLENYKNFVLKSPIITSFLTQLENETYNLTAKVRILRKNISLFSKIKNKLYSTKSISETKIKEELEIMVEERGQVRERSRQFLNRVEESTT